MAKNKKMTVTLVGTYRKACKKWIQEKMLYNYPIAKTGDRNFNPEIITHLFLHNGKAKLLKFGASLLKTVGVSELKALGYPVSDKPRSDKYALFALKPYQVLDSKIKGTKSNKTITYDQFAVSLEDFANTDEDKAILSHWIHNKGTTFAKPYEKRSKQLLSKELMDYFVRGNVLCESAVQQTFFPELFDVPFRPHENTKFTFIDLFAGIGGFRIAMQSLGGKCVFSSEWDEAAQKSYLANYGEVPFGDITSKETKDAIPSGFDIVCAGFPCQAFSLAGQRKGFEDNFKGMSRGTLFKDVVDICEKHKPKAIFCENVKGLTIHDKGRTFEVIKGAFRELGYEVFSQILNSKDFGVPQNRERIYIVAFRKDIAPEKFKFPSPTDATRRIKDIIESTPVSARYYLSNTYFETLKRHRSRHEAKGNGFGYEIRPMDGIAGAIVCGGMGRERNLIIDKRQTNLTPETHIKGEINKEGIRKMTPREWARLQGYPDSYKFALSDVHLYKQFGNSVSVPVIEAISRCIAEVLGYE